jgi:hypothetical protein
MKKPTAPNLSFLETDLFGTLLEFNKKIVELLQQLAVDDEGKALANQRVESMINDITADIGRSQDFNLKNRLESVYDEMKRLLDEVATPDEPGEGGEPSKR